MNLLLQTLAALRHTVAKALRAAPAESPRHEPADAADLQQRMAAQARNSMGLLSISNR